MLSITEFDIDAIEAIQNIGHWLLPAMEALSLVSSAAGYAMVIIVAYIGASTQNSA